MLYRHIEAYTHRCSHELCQIVQCGQSNTVNVHYFQSGPLVSNFKIAKTTQNIYSKLKHLNVYSGTDVSNPQAHEANVKHIAISVTNVYTLVNLL